MINKVLIEGDVVRSTWGKTAQNGFFITLKQERKFGEFAWSSYFSLYANKPLANQLAKLVEENPNVHITVEGRLRTYHSKKSNEWKTTILIEKILDSSNATEQPKTEQK